MYNKITKLAPIKLATDQIKQGVSGNWNIVGGTSHLSRTYQFKNFEDTWGFLTKVAMRSHLMGHHPTLETTYNVVKIKLTTHDVGGVSDVDLKMAKRFESYYKEYNGDNATDM